MANAFRSILASEGGAPVTSLTADASSVKTTFNVGEVFNSNGLVVNAEVGTALEGDVVNDCIITPPSASTFTEDDIGYHDVGINYFGTATSYQIRVKKGVDIVPFASGTDKQILDMMNAYYAGDLSFDDIEGWDVGAERTISLPAMSGLSTSSQENHAAQSATLVILHDSGYELTTSIGNKTHGKFIIGMKNAMWSSNGLNQEYGMIHSVGRQIKSWDLCERRTWCNNTFRDSLSSDLKQCFRQFKDPIWKDGQVITVDDYISLPSAYEICGSGSQWLQEGIQLDYYKTASNHFKYNGNNSQDIAYYWLRSPINNTGDYYTWSYYWNSTVPDFTAQQYNKSAISVFGVF